MALSIWPLLSKDSPETVSPDELARGKRLFESHCARCHGMRGGGGLGPSLASVPLRHAPDFAALTGVISNGIPGTAMPGAWQLWGSGDVKLIAAYVRSLGEVAQTPVPGDPVRGKAIYEGKGTCVTCHIVRGHGGVQGPNLTDIGRRRGVDYLRQALVDPGAVLPEGRGDDFAPSSYAQFLPVQAVTRDGQEISGVRLNEDDFSIQLRDSTNRLYSLRKAELKELRKEFGKSIMPSYESTLTAAELDDLVAYLASLRGEQ